MNDGSEWDRRYGSKCDVTDELKSYLRVRLFGPYAGECGDILEDIADKLREEEKYNVEICSDLSATRKLKNTYEEGEPTYNFINSLDCISEADVCVFLFMDARKSRFDVIKAEDDDYPDLNEDRHRPQDLNSSVVLEFEEWCNGPSSYHDGYVVYEKFGGGNIGSLIRGCVDTHTIPASKVKTYEKNSVKELSDRIAGKCRNWFDEYSERLIERRNRTK